jgi:hypothetical protein
MTQDPTGELDPECLDVRRLVVRREILVACR